MILFSLLVDQLNYFSLFLFAIFAFSTTSNAFFKFNNLNEVREKVDGCKLLLRSADDVEKLMNVTVLPSNIRKSDVCFLKCIYEKAGLMNKYGSIVLSYSLPIIESLITMRTLRTMEEQGHIASNLILVCESDEKLICLKAVQTINCLEIAIFLHNLGYINNNIANKRLDILKLKEIFKESVMQFQLFFNLEVTGIPGEDMQQLISVARCGVVDIESEANRRKRFTLADDKKWRKNQITYKISKYPENLPKQEVDDRIAEAFREWTNQTPLQINKKTSGEVDIEIDFLKDNHGDEIPFDGPGGYLAHTFYPKMYPDKGQKSFIHFDSTEKWTTDDSKSGVKLFQVALHEIGHSLGLRHSKKKNAIMWPLHKNNQRNYTLAKDDIRGIRKLYDTSKNWNLFQKFKNALYNIFSIKNS